MHDGGIQIIDGGRGEPDVAAVGDIAGRKGRGPHRDGRRRHRDDRKSSDQDRPPLSHVPLLWAQWTAIGFDLQGKYLREMVGPAGLEPAT